MRTYNHAFTLGFAVPGSHYEDWQACLKNEKDKVIHALMLRVAELTNNTNEFMEALDGFDTFNENFTGFDSADEEQE